MLAVALAAVATLVTILTVGNPARDTLWYEAAKTCLQVLGVVLVGGIVTIATSDLQHARAEAAQHLERMREDAQAEIESERKEFDRRAALLERTSRCAQKMFVTCQHVRRVQADHPSAQATLSAARSLLDEAYRDFSIEGTALETEIGARYGIRITAGNGNGGQAYARWHQVRDLLTLYYFNLCGDFRADVLTRNAESDEALHSGLTAEDLKVADPRRPTPDELRVMRIKIRKRFALVTPMLAQALLEDDVVSGDILPRRKPSAAGAGPVAGSASSRTAG